MTTRSFSFVGRAAGAWKVIRQVAVSGEALPTIAALDVVPGIADATLQDWVLRGITSNERYVERAEKEQLVSKQQGLGRPEAKYAALIPIRKNAA